VLDSAYYSYLFVPHLRGQLDRAFFETPRVWLHPSPLKAETLTRGANSSHRVSGRVTKTRQLEAR
jgi:hypothetical protein